MPIVIRGLPHEAFDELDASWLEYYCVHSLATMRTTRLVHFRGRTAGEVYVIWTFVAKWGTRGQLQKLRRVLLTANVESPADAITTESDIAELWDLKENDLSALRSAGLRKVADIIGRQRPDLGRYVSPETARRVATACRKLSLTDG